MDKMLSNEIEKKLVLIGGGHSHAIALRLWGLNPLKNVQLTLITDTEKTPYSGMLPGHVSGYYSYEETHIDLVKLARFAKANFYLDKAIGLDLENNLIFCQSNSSISFDYLSIDIGSTPATNSIPGAKEYTIAAKPVPLFLNIWESLLARVNSYPAQPLKIVIVGGGAGGVELALNMESHLKKITDRVTIDLINRDNKLLSGHNNYVSKTLENILKKRGINIYLQTEVVRVLPQKIICNNEIKIDSDYTFWVTQASAPDWIKASGLTTDNRGFILVDDTLQSLSHPYIFAAGDIATMKNYSRPKAGVFAVRQGKPLLENWQKIILEQPLKKYIPQEKYLALIGTGNKNAIASWGNWGWHSSLLWLWKEKIDRQFMHLFDSLET